MSAGVSDAAGCRSRPLPLVGGEEQKSPRGRLPWTPGRPGRNFAASPGAPRGLQPRELLGASRQMAPRAAWSPRNVLTNTSGLRGRGSAAAHQPWRGPLHLEIPRSRACLPTFVSSPWTAPWGTFLRESALVIHEKPQTRKTKLRKLTASIVILFKK